MKLYGIKINGMENPIGIGNETTLSYKISSERSNMLQRYVRIVVSDDINKLDDLKDLVFDTGKLESDKNIHHINIEKLTSTQRYFFKVRIWDDIDEESEWSEVFYFETGFLDNKLWKAKWIMDGSGTADTESPYFRKEFNVSSEIKDARLYISGRGLFEAFLNGNKIGNDYLTPGFTSMKKRIQYLTYDISNMLTDGENAFGVILGDGWYKGHFGFMGEDCLYGDKLSFISQIEIEYKDGKRETIISDSSFKSYRSHIRYSNIYNGEVQDLNFYQENWNLPGFDDEKWSKAIETHEDKDILVPIESYPVRKFDEIEPVEIIKTPQGDTVIDFGQILSGWVEIECEGNKSSKIELKHFEVLDKEGNCYFDNIREAKQEAVYTLSDNGKVNLRPHFTFFGFRYVRVSGIDEIKLSDYKAVVLASECQIIGTFECSDWRLNKLQHNIQWGQRGNFVDIPTDCPQRNERLGWTGDAQAFISTACFNMDVYNFFKKWLVDLKLDQFKNGSVPHVIPDVVSLEKENPDWAGSTGWADAATVVPYTMYIRYGDEDILTRQYGSMKRWVDYSISSLDDDFIWRKGFHYGDWLAKDWPEDVNTNFGATARDFMATAFLLNSIDILYKTASILGNEDDYKEYKRWYKKIKEAFRDEFVSNATRIASDTQSSYVLPLVFDLLDEKQKKKAADRLVKKIREKDNHLTTGFLSTPHLLHALSDNGKIEVAYDLLFQDTCPSWIYPVLKGATTIWERWDGIKPDGSFQDETMNSFNHYSYGAVGDFMYRKVAGLNYDEKRPGYKHIIFNPMPDKRLKFAKANLNTPYGLACIEWKYEESFIVEIEIPANSEATFVNPFEFASELIIDGKTTRVKDTYEFGSGKHTIAIK